MFVATKLRSRISRRAAAAVGITVVLGVGALAVRGPAPAPPPVAPQAASPVTVLVFVSGAVVHPGLLRLSADARIADVVSAAGGLVAGADPARLPNLAGRVHDGLQVVVPFATGPSQHVVRVDINAASMAELAAVPGMVPGLAQAIVLHRTRWGAYLSVSELRTDLELDAATYAAISPWLRALG